MKGLIASILVAILGTNGIAQSVLAFLNQQIVTEADYISVGVLVFLGMPLVMLGSFLTYIWVEDL